MDSTERLDLTQDDASVTPLADVHLMFVCGGGGTIFAHKNLKFVQLHIPQEQGKLIQVSSVKGSIDVKPGIDAAHTTLIGLTNGRNPDELHIRIPIGVRFYRISPPSVPTVQGYEQEFYFYAGNGYDIYPLLLLRGSDPPKQKVQELILITSHVPPRRDPLTAQDKTLGIVPLNPDQLKALKKPDVPAETKRRKRVTS